jgi:hypothetical protein
MEAQRLASLGQLAAAEQVMSRVRQLLTNARGEEKVAEPQDPSNRVTLGLL